MSRNSYRALLILLFESLLTCLCALAAIYIRFSADFFVALIDQYGWLRIILLIVVLQGSFYIFDLYDFRRIRQPSTLYIRIFQAIGLAAIIMALIFYTVPRTIIGRGVFLVSLLLMLTIMACWRVVAMWLLGHPKLAERVLILGTGENAINIARETLERKEDGYEIIGFVGDDPQLLGQSLINPRVIGLTSELESIVRFHQPDRIVIAIGDRRGRLPVEPLLKMRLRGDLAVEESSSFYERLTGKISTEMLRPSWLIFSNGSRRIGFYRQARNVAEIVLATLGLITSLPLIAIVAAAIRLESRGSVFYTQERVGLHNRVFRIIKLRSMRTDAEKNGPVWAGESDPRVTRVGRIIRKLRIDELPQFINVIRGEMSFIGPRPERPVFVEQLEREIPYYSQRHVIKPGLTGWAQIRYPYGASIEDARQKLQYDLYYIKNQSYVLDAIILFETVRIVLFGRGAR